jgi:sugar lactone lactonase YvrE
MKKWFTVICLMVILVGLTFAGEWKFKEVVVCGQPEGTDAGQAAVNLPGLKNPYGVAVDPDGNIWFSAYYRSRISNYDAAGKVTYTYPDDITWKREGKPDTLIGTIPIYILNTNGTIDRLQFLELPDGKIDTLKAGAGANGTYGSRGMDTDPKGNIIAAQYDRIYQIDYKTRKVLNKVNMGAQTGRPAVDGAGNIFTLPLLGGTLSVLDPDLFTLYNSIPNVTVTSRGISVTPDAKQVFVATLAAGAYRYVSQDGVDGTYAIADTILKQVRNLNAAINFIQWDPKGLLWCASVEEQASPFMWALDPNDNFAVVDSTSFKWFKTNTSDTTHPAWPRRGYAQPQYMRAPRDAAFSPDGKIMYIADMYSYTIKAFEYVGEDMVKVTFWANTATVPDTLGPKSTVQIRGSGGPLSWDGNSPVRLHNVGGDLWTGSALFKAGEAVQFKFYTNAHDTVYGGCEWEHQGWEGNTDLASGNREITVGATSMTLDPMFVNGWKDKAGVYEKPFKADDGHFVIWVRTNVQGYEDFNPALHKVGIRGSNMKDWGQTGNISWGKTLELLPEENHVNGGSRQYTGSNFYSGAIQVPIAYAGAGVQFKVVVHNKAAALDEDWGNMILNSSREEKVYASGKDTTNYWFWIDNKSPSSVSHSDQVIVTFKANLSKTITAKGFAFGDTLLVRSGYYGTASETRTKTMVRQGFTAVYSATDTITTTIGKPLNYQFYKVKNGVEYREIFYNFYYNGSTAGQAERREATVTASPLLVEDVLNSESELHRMPVFRNTAVLARDVLVTLTCDARPAMERLKTGGQLTDIQGVINVTSPDQVKTLGMAVNGPFTGGWGTWGIGLMASATNKMWDDGTHGDAVANDGIYTLQVQFNKDSLDVIGQEFKFGIGGGDNEGGYGNNHIENIDDTNGAFTIAAQFGSIDPVAYSAWDYDKRGPKTAVEKLADRIPAEFSLVQNYPNPFNPTTMISYNLPKATDVRLTVYNILGAKIATLVDGKQAAGSYKANWNAMDESGRAVSAGVYFYRIEAGTFSKTMKMLLVK